jgi:hypothetical protein
MTFIATCGQKQFFVSNRTNTMSGVWETCCAAGLIPASLDSKEQLDCLRNSPNKYNVGKGDNLTVISHVLDMKLNRNFVACYDYREHNVSSDIWAIDEPNNENGLESCSELYLCSSCNNSGLHDKGCLLQRNILCQYLLKNQPNALNASQVTIFPNTTILVS